MWLSLWVTESTSKFRNSIYIKYDGYCLKWLYNGCCKHMWRQGRQEVDILYISLRLGRKWRGKEWGKLKETLRRWRGAEKLSLDKSWVSDQTIQSVPWQSDCRKMCVCKDKQWRHTAFPLSLLLIPSLVQHSFLTVHISLSSLASSWFACCLTSCMCLVVFSTAFVFVVFCVVSVDLAKHYPYYRGCNQIFKINQM